jgi:hypothetical protein
MKNKGIYTVCAVLVSGMLLYSGDGNAKITTAIKSAQQPAAPQPAAPQPAAPQQPAAAQNIQDIINNLNAQLQQANLDNNALRQRLAALLARIDELQARGGRADPELLVELEGLRRALVNRNVGEGGGADERELRRQIANLRQEIADLRGGGGGVGGGGVGGANPALAQFQERFADPAHRQEALQEFRRLAENNPDQANPVKRQVFDIIQNELIGYVGQPRHEAQMGEILQWLGDVEDDVVILQQDARRALQAFNNAEFQHRLPEYENALQQVRAGDLNARAQQWPLAMILEQGFDLRGMANRMRGDGGRLLYGILGPTVEHGTSPELKGLLVLLRQAGYGNLPENNYGRTLYDRLEEKVIERDRANQEVADNNNAIEQIVVGRLTDAFQPYAPIDINALVANAGPLPPVPDRPEILANLNARPILLFLALPKDMFLERFGTPEGNRELMELYRYTTADDLRVMVHYLTSPPEQVTNDSPVNIKKMVASLVREINDGRRAVVDIGNIPFERNGATASVRGFINGNNQLRNAYGNVLAEAAGGVPGGGAPGGEVGGENPLIAACQNPGAQAGWIQVQNKNFRAFEDNRYVEVGAPHGEQLGAGLFGFRGASLDPNAVIDYDGDFMNLNDNQQYQALGGAAVRKVDAWFDPGTRTIKCLTALIRDGNWRAR